MFSKNLVQLYYAIYQESPQSICLQFSLLQFVIGSAGTSLPDAPEPQRKFVIGAAANGDQVRRPLSSRTSPAVGAAASERRPTQVASSRSTPVIGAAGNQRQSSRPRRPSAPSGGTGRASGIVIGLRHNNRRKRLLFE